MEGGGEGGGGGGGTPESPPISAHLPSEIHLGVCHQLSTSLGSCLASCTDSM